MWQTFKKLRTSRSIVEHCRALRLFWVGWWSSSFGISILHSPVIARRGTWHPAWHGQWQSHNQHQSTGSICCKYQWEVSTSKWEYPVRPFSERSVSTECFWNQFVVWVEAYIGCWIYLLDYVVADRFQSSRGITLHVPKVGCDHLGRLNFQMLQFGAERHVTDRIEYNRVINYLQPRKTLADVDTPSSPSSIWFDPCRCPTALAMPSGGEDSWQVPFMQIHQICESSESSEYRCLYWLAIGLLLACYGFAMSGELCANLTSCEMLKERISTWCHSEVHSSWSV